MLMSDNCDHWLCIIIFKEGITWVKQHLADGYPNTLKSTKASQEIWSTFHEQLELFQNKQYVNLFDAVC